MFTILEKLKGKPRLVDIDVTFCDDLLDTLNANR